MMKTKTLIVVLLAALGSSACVAPLIVGGAMAGGALVAIDRRTSGAQLEDKAIELKASNRINEKFGSEVHVNVESYNRVLLLTGEAPTEAARDQLTTIANGVENVQNVINEVAVLANTSLGSRSNDVLINSKVKATLIDAQNLQSNAFDVVVERGNVYLMGIVTQRESDAATGLIRTISGVVKVVACFEIVSEDELARLVPKPAPKSDDTSK